MAAHRTLELGLDTPPAVLHKAADSLVVSGRTAVAVDRTAAVVAHTAELVRSLLVVAAHCNLEAHRILLVQLRTAAAAAGHHQPSTSSRLSYRSLDRSHRG